MKCHIFLRCVCVFFLSYLLLGQKAYAEITNVSVSPALINVVIDNPATLTVNLNWTVTLSESDALAREGEFFLPNRDGPLATVNTVLSVTAPTNTPPQPVIVGETLVIDQSLAQSWWDLNLRQVSYGRFFRDGQASIESAVVTINLSASTPMNPGVPQPPVGGPTIPPRPDSPIEPLQSAQGLERLRAPSQALRINRLELNFSDESSIAYVDKDSALYANLDVSYQGIGVLRGYWQIADPVGPIGELQFRNLRLLNKQLSAAQEARIKSPRLPTKLEGRYYLRFCVTGIGQINLPERGGAECPSEVISTVVGYQVFRAKNTIKKIIGLRMSDREVGVKTLFSWPPIKYAEMYQLRLFSFSDSPRKMNLDDMDEDLTFIGGMLLSNDSTQVNLSEFLLSKTVPANTNCWKVLAFADDGSLLSESDCLTFEIAQPEL